MEHKNIFSFDVEWNYKSISLFLILLVLPNLLSVFNIDTGFGFKIHLFQIGIFIAALVYGPLGGLAAGFTGSMYSAFIMNNPYLVFGNMILGAFAGLFARYGLNIVIAVLIAYMIQIPYLVLTDYYLMHMPFKVILALVIALFVSNVAWAIVAHYSAKPIKKYI